MFNSINDLRTYILAGHATITISSDTSEKHYTYKFSRKEDSNMYFVSVLTAPDMYSYAALMLLNPGNISLRHTKGSKIAGTAPSMTLLSDVIRDINANDNNRLFALLNIMHDGSCGRCGRQLTRPDSIRNGIGPECANKLA